MKFLISLLVFVSASAFACPDISGTYLTAEGTHIKYVQTLCTSLKRYLGEEANDGTVSFPEPGTVFKMDGKPDCGIRDFCTTVTAHDDGIEFSLNFTGGVDTDTHGSCDQRGFVLSLDSDQNLIGTYAAFNCADKFIGTAVKTFKHYK